MEMAMRDYELRIGALERRCTRLNVTIVVLALVVAGEAAVGTVRSTAFAATTTKAAQDVMRVHQLSVVDARGVERVRIGAPVADGPIFGKRVYRGSESSGIILFDAEGNERGGYVTFDEGGAALTLDALGRMVVRLSADDLGGARLEIFGNRDAVAKIGTVGETPFVSLLRDDSVLFTQPNARPSPGTP
jgi:hypothetical protein